MTCYMPEPAHYGDSKELDSFPDPRGLLQQVESNVQILLWYMTEARYKDVEDWKMVSKRRMLILSQVESRLEYLGAERAFPTKGQHK